MALQIKTSRSVVSWKTTGAFFAVLAFFVQPLVTLNLPAAFAAGTSIPVTPSSLSIVGSGTKSASADASNYTGLKLSFHYNVQDLEDGEGVIYGWRAEQGQAFNYLGSLEGRTGSNSIEVGDITNLALPSTANVSDLELGFSSNSVFGSSNDDVQISNITLTGNQVPTYSYNISSSLPSNVEKGTQVTYTVSTSTTDTTTPSVRVVANDGGAGGTYEFQDSSNNWHAFDPSAGPFGPFPLTNNGTTNMRATYANVGTFTQSLRLEKADGTLLATATQPLTVTEAPKPVTDITTNQSYRTIQEAIDACSATCGDTLQLNSDITVPAQVNVNKKITLDGQGHTILVSGTDYRFLITAAGVTFKNLNITKTDKIGTQNIVGVQAKDVTIDHVNFAGQFNIGDDDTSRALEVSSVSNLTVENSSFKHLRQPAYVNTATGTFSNNYTSDTKGWVLVANSDIHFSGNTWGTNVTDIAVIDDDKNPATSITNNYTCAVMAQIKSDNNASIDNQVPYDAPCVVATPTNLQLKYSGAVNNLTANSDGNYVIRNVSKNIQLTWTNGSNVNAAGVRTHVTFPDGTTQDYYQGVPYNYTNLNPRDSGQKFAANGEGKYVYTVEVKDASGKWSQPSAPLTVYYVNHIPTATFEATPSRYVNGDFQVTIVGKDTTVLRSVGADVRDPSAPAGTNSYVTGCTNPTLLDGAALPVYSDNGSGVTVKVTCTIKAANLVDGHTYTLRALAGFVEANGSSYGNTNSDGKWTFTYDKTDPVGTLTYSPSTLTNGNVMATLTTTEPIQTPTGWTWKSDTRFQKSYPKNNKAPNYDQTITIADLAGNTNTAHVYIDWIDITPPSTPTITAPTSTYLNNGIVFRWSAATDANDIDHYEVTRTYTRDGNTITSVKTENGLKNTLDLSEDGRDDGPVSVKVCAYDKVGNSACDNASYVFDATAPANVTATYTGGLKDVTTPTAVTGVLVGGDLTFQVSETEQNPSNMYAEINWLNPATNKWEKHAGWGKTITSDNGTLSLASTAPSGKYQIKVSSIRDAAGNTAPTQTFGFTVDNAAPAAPTISPADGATIKGSQSFTATKIDNNDSLTVSSSVGTIVDNGDGTYTLDTTRMQKGVQVTITAVEKDAAGNSAAAQATYTVDNSDLAPSLAVGEPRLNDNGSYTISGTTNGTSLTVEVDSSGTQIPVTIDPNTGAWTYTTPQFEPGSSHTVNVTSKDDYGYSTSKSTSFTVPSVGGEEVHTRTSGLSLLENQDGDGAPTVGAVSPALAATTLDGTSPSNSEKNTRILGATSDNALKDTAAISPSTQGWKLFGVAWYWWLLALAAVASIWWFLAARRRRANNDSVAGLL